LEYKGKLKIINDPIYGFITVPTSFLFKLIEHRYFQRLRRISQMGMSYLVYPGAHHTRFHHALGAMFLMQRAIQVLRLKGVKISDIEEEALCAAILLHDIGHGPFSHAMEHSIVEEVSHEHISLLFMQALNEEFSGRLSLAITIFKNEYHRKFMHQLISGQLDMDRLDYLRRDSFYTGVQEGTVNSQRLITMLNVHDDRLVVEEKGVYSVEKFIIARRFMYWQVYLHKTGIVAEQLLMNLLKRAKELTQNGLQLQASEALSYFLRQSISLENFNSGELDRFSKLDDYDIISVMKSWTTHDDFVLRNLSEMLLNRELLKIKLSKTPFSKVQLLEKQDLFRKKYDLTITEASYFVFDGKIENLAYRKDTDAIYLLTKKGKLVDVASASDLLNLKALSKTVVKYYLCYPKPTY
jgi:HD superfamily phosphohydrolase